MLSLMVTSSGSLKLSFFFSVKFFLCDPGDFFLCDVFTQDHLVFQHHQKGAKSWLRGVSCMVPA